jgi:NAD-dependent deacetylase
MPTLPSLPAGDAPIVVMSGAGLSAASGVPTFRGGGGLWEGHRLEDVATPDAWHRQPALVRRFYDLRRQAAAAARPNAGHLALARLQRALGHRRVLLVTQNVDGLLDEAGAIDVVEMHGNLRRLRCAWSERHPHVAVGGAQDEEAECEVCGHPLRPDIVWFGEVPHHLARIDAAARACSVFLSVGTSGVVYPAAGYVGLAADHDALCIEVNTEPAGGPFDIVFAEASEVLLPRLVDHWLQA